MNYKQTVLPFLCLLLACAATFALENGLARTPPMGWYPWNAFSEGPQVEPLIREIADSMVAKGMKDAGYAYVGPDEAACFYRDLYGLLQTNIARFPSGMKSLGDYLHAKGLKYALYTDAGTRTCTGDMPGTKDHEGDDMRSFAAWGCDYIKVDWCNTGGMTPLPAYAKLRDSLLACGRPIVYGLCDWGQDNPADWADTVGNLWRMGGDIASDWNGILGIANANSALYTHAGPGAWNDPDMLEIGVTHTGPGLNEAQGRSHFSLWCIMASPLIAGNDVRAMTASEQAIYTNLEAIAVNQDPLGIQGHRIRISGTMEIWAGKRLFDTSFAAVAFNNGGATQDIIVHWSDIGASAGTSLYVRDLWKHTTSGPYKDSVTVNVATDDVAMLRFCKLDSFPVPPIIVADNYLLQFTAQKESPGQFVDSIVLSNKGSDDLPLWSVSDSIAWLSVSVNKSGKDQRLVNTVQTTGLNAGLYHAIVRAYNTEPRTGLPMSMVTYDVELKITSPDTTPLPIWTRVDDTSHLITYSPGWNVITGDPYDFHGTLHYYDQKDATAEFTFEGNAVKILGRMQFNAGTADIYLDGALDATINTYNCCTTAGVIHQALLFERVGLSNGAHTIKVVVVGPDLTGIDAFEYTDSPATVCQSCGASRTMADDLTACPVPFNPALNVRFSIGRPGMADVSVYALNGKKIVTLCNGWRSAGTYAVSWNGRDRMGGAMASGVYLIRYATSTSSLIKNVTLMK